MDFLWNSVEPSLEGIFIFTLPFPIFSLVHVQYSSSDPLDTDDQLFYQTAFTR